jgi:hypothetical protein
MILKDTKNSTKILLDLINTISKVAVYKINIQKLLAFQYTNNKQSDKEIRKKNLIHDSLKNTQE